MSRRSLVAVLLPALVLSGLGTVAAPAFAADVTVTGTVVAEQVGGGTQPVAGADVWFTTDEGGQVFLVTDVNGAFSAQIPADADATLSFGLPAGSNPDLLVGDTRTVAVPGGGPFQLVLRRPTLTGTITGAGGDPASGAEISAYDETADAAVGRGTAPYADNHGKYGLALTAGHRYRLTALPSGDGSGPERAVTTTFEHTTGEVRDLSLRTAAGLPWTLSQASLRPGGTPGQGNGVTATALSGDGKAVAFGSADSGLTADAGDSQEDVFLHKSGATTLLSKGAGGRGDGPSGSPSLNDDGTRVAFDSTADNLLAAPENDNQASDVLLWQSGATPSLLSLSDGFAWANRPSLSGNGAKAVFVGVQDAGTEAGTGNLWVAQVTGDVVTHVNLTGLDAAATTAVVSPQISRDGTRVVAYEQTATGWDVVVRDTADGAVKRRTTLNDGADFQAAPPSLTADGATAVFSRPIGDDLRNQELVRLTVASGDTTVIPGLGFGTARHNDFTCAGEHSPRISADGSTVVFLACSPESAEMGENVWSRALAEPDADATLVSVSKRGWLSNGAPYVGGVSTDGGTVVFGARTLEAVDPPSALPQALVAKAVTDTAAPAWPGKSLTASNVGQTQVTLTWSAATDATGVAGYRVLQGGSQVKEVVGDTGVTITGLTKQTTYQFQVQAFDGFGNVSTDGPTLSVTTAGAATPGSATLSAVPDGSAKVKLTWDPADGATGYRIYRKIGGGTPAAIHDTGAVITWTDPAAPAESALTYHVAALTGGGEQAHTKAASVTTPALGPVTGVAATAPTLLKPGLVAMGSDVILTVTGDAGRQVTGKIAVDRWSGTAVSPGTKAAATLDLPLTETGTPGTYRGTLAIPDGVARITGISAVLTDGAGHQVAGTGTFASDVSGAIAVTVDTQGLAFPGGRLMVNDATTWAPGLDKVLGATAGNPAVQTVPLLPSSAGGGYQVDLQVGTANTTAPKVAVTAGLITALTLKAKIPAGLEVTYAGQTAATLRGTEVTLVDADSGEVLMPGVLSEGTSVDFGFLAAGQEVEVRTAFPDGVELRQPEPTTTTLTAPTNDLTITPQPLPKGTLRGTVLAPGGAPVPWARITVDQHVDGRDWTYATTASASGTYELQALQGSARVSAGFNDETQSAETMVGAVPTVVDFAMTSTAPHLIEVDLRTKLAGQSDFTRVAVDWRTSSHFYLRVKVGSDESGFRAAPGWFGEVEPNLKAVYGREGEVVEVCANAAEAGIAGDQCDTVVLGAAGEPAKVEFRFEAGARVEGDLLGPDGKPFVGRWRATVVRPGPDGPLTSARYGSGPVVGMDLGAGGPFDLTVEDDRNVSLTASASGTVGTGALVDVGTLELTGGGQLARASSVVVGAELLAQGESVPVSATIRNDADPGVTDVVVELTEPRGAQVDLASVTVNGAPAAGATRSSGVVSVPVGALPEGGEVRVNYVLTAATAAPGSTILARVAVRYKKDAATERTVLASRPVLVAGVSIEAPGTVTSPAVTLSGRAPAGSSVEVYDGGVRIGTATAGQGGFWTLATTLVDRGALRDHRLTASVRGDDALVSAPATVRLADDEPVLTQVKVINHGEGPADKRTHAWDPRQGLARFPFIFVPRHPLEVRATFSEPSRVSNVVAHLGPYQQAAEPEGGAFTATFADVQTMGEISFDYDIVPADYDMTATITKADFDASLPPGSASYEEVDAPTEVPVAGGKGATGTYRAPFVQAASGDGDVGISYEVTNKPVDYTVTAEDAAAQERTGVPVWGLSATRNEQTGAATMTFYVPRPPAPAPAAGRRSVAQAALPAGTATKAYEISAKVFGTALGGNPVEVAVNTAILDGNIASAYANEDAYEAGYYGVTTLRKYEGQCAGVTKEKLDELSGKVGFALSTNKMFIEVSNRVNLALGILGMVPYMGIPSAALGVGWDAVISERNALNIDPVLAELKALAENCTQLNPDERERLLGVKPAAGGSNRRFAPAGNATGIIDPAGYLYSGVESNRVPGATAVLAASSTEDGPDGPWSQWAAEDFGQINPLITDHEGRYAWFVPPGFYQVFYTADGYLPAQSEVLEVAPPHFDVNINLTPIAAPKVRSVTSADGTVIVEFDQYMSVATVTPATLSVLKGEAPVTGTVTPLNAEDSPDGTPLASRFAFVPAAALGNGTQVSAAVDATVRSFAGRPLAEGASRTVAIAGEKVVPPPGPSGPSAACVAAQTAAGQATAAVTTAATKVKKAKAKLKKAKKSKSKAKIAKAKKKLKKAKKAAKRAAGAAGSAQAAASTACR